MNYQAIQELLEKANTYYGNRIASQLDFASVMSMENGGKYDDIVSEAVNFAYSDFLKNKAITKTVAEKTEKMLEPLRDKAKSYTMLCVSHAHIDMNWMWGYDETVNITLSTFRTMLQLMKEYPDFTFSQSQASCYKIVEEHDPEMLDEIRKRVKEGRWEVVATNWVELDKNMPNGEEQTRHILYTKKYLTGLLGLKNEDLTIDFEPDTFGHNANVPMILTKSGVKYLYHCRGNIAPALYYWKAQNGDKILVFREPTCYNWSLKPTDFRNVPAFSKQYGIQKILKVYGVGDHGGGSSRKDIELIKDMQNWPAMPSFKFSNYREFFTYVENCKPKLETREGEQNFVFRGCYSTQSKIKGANRKNLNEFFKTEQLQALVKSTKDRAENIEEAWQKHLFGHFHDILTGSGVEMTRNYQLGKAQEVHAELSSQRTKELISLSELLDTSAYCGKIDLVPSLALGAGVGYDKNVFVPNTAEGKNRLFLLYNYGGVSGEKTVELTLWDFEGQTEHLQFTDTDGKKLTFEFIDENPVHYWGHWYRRVLVSADVPAYGYTVVVLNADKNEIKPIEYPPLFQRREDVPEYIIENEYLRAEFDLNTTALVSLTNKETGETYSGEKLGCFRFIEEENSKGMSGWVTGNYSNVIDITQNVKMISGSLKKGALKQSFNASATFGNSIINYTVSLSKGDRFLRYDCECDFYERGKNVIPQLNYRLSLPQAKRYCYDIPYGLVERKQYDGDVVANTFACADLQKSTLILTTDSKYGFRAARDELTTVLLRASYDPDPYPEVGMHKFEIGIGFSSGSGSSLIKAASEFAPQIESITVSAHNGVLPLKSQLLKIDGDVVLSSIKLASDGNGIVIRLYNPTKEKKDVILSIIGKSYQLWLCDGNEVIQNEISGNKFVVDGYDVITVKLTNS